MNSPLHEAPDPVWARIGKAIDGHRRFVVTTHVHPDGDGLGAELGLWSYLRELGKDVRIVNQDPLLERFRFLDEAGCFEVYDAARHDAMIRDREVAILVDLSRWDRVGGPGPIIRAGRALTVCIDHHPPEDGAPADLNGIDPTAAASGQLIYELIRGRGHSVNRTTALGLYVSILTDTGSFRFSNSDSRAHRAAADLLVHDLEPSRIYERVFGSFSTARLELLGSALTTMRTAHQGGIILLSVSREMIEACGAHPSDAEGFVDVARSAGRCRVVALLLELEDGSIKVSFRSKGEVSVGAAASGLGGGGHDYAAGASLPGPLEDATARVLTALDSVMDAREPVREP